MCRDAPSTVAFLLEKANSGELQVEIIETAPREYVYNTFNGNCRGADQRTWRAALRREPRVITILGDWCEVLPSDQPLLTRVFLKDAMLYSCCHEHIRRLKYVAHIVFSHDGLRIRNSPLVDNKQFALTAVRQNGLALKYISVTGRNSTWMLCSKPCNRTGWLLPGFVMLTPPM